ncbi:hypothetical protein FHG87_025976, partial [Trinorchestia longiramus]
LVSSPATALARAATNPLSMTAEKVSSPTRVAQAHRIAYHQSLGSPQKLARHSFNGR